LCEDKHDEGDVAVFSREVPPFAGAPGVHQRGERLLYWLRHSEALGDPQELAFEIELVVARPQHLHYLDPLGRIVVARVVLHRKRPSAPTALMA
jgi:hypothetical protein